MFLISATNTEAGDQSATDDSHKEAVDAMIQDNRRITQREILEELGISQERVGCIIADDPDDGTPSIDASSQVDSGEPTFRQQSQYCAKIRLLQIRSAANSVGRSEAFISGVNMRGTHLAQTFR